ncbi:hypothetical protein HNR46_001308 [Haloferula luteola]|uniref:Uncharacterized protein n=1 Tax=Haloferula luteola TaxID=595692 RepID=A0A840V619_9BACT|nr:hypothetical protein [Haloferula luteola]MBB5351074.1 hypothetical protein [Haloferula luteola]
MPTTESQLRREECRHAVRGHLYARQAISQSATTIRRGLAREYDFTLSEVEAAAEFLTGLEQLSVTPDALGGSRYYRITAIGILAEERG